jgi:hypothetical protein
MWRIMMYRDGYDDVWVEYNRCSDECSLYELVLELVGEIIDEIMGCPGYRISPS